MAGKVLLCRPFSIYCFRWHVLVSNCSLIQKQLKSSCNLVMVVWTVLFILIIGLSPFNNSTRTFCVFLVKVILLLRTWPVEIRCSREFITIGMIYTMSYQGTVNYSLLWKRIKILVILNWDVKCHKLICLCEFALCIL